MQITSDTCCYINQALRPVTRRAIFMVSRLLEQQRVMLCSIKGDPEHKKYLSVLLLGTCVIKAIALLTTKNCDHAKAAIKAIEAGSSNMVSTYVRALQKYALEIGGTVASLPVEVCASLRPNPISEAAGAVPSIVIDNSLDEITNQQILNMLVVRRVESFSAVFGFSAMPR